jgi:hypothetical protein
VDLVKRSKENRGWAKGYGELFRREGWSLLKRSGLLELFSISDTTHSRPESNLEKISNNERILDVHNIIFITS